MASTCSKPGCNNPTNLRCPKCKELGIMEASSFCSQDCFKSVWAEHKTIHTQSKAGASAKPKAASSARKVHNPPAFANSPFDSLSGMSSSLPDVGIRVDDDTDISEVLARQLGATTPSARAHVIGNMLTMLLQSGSLGEALAVARGHLKTEQKAANGKRSLVVAGALASVGNVLLTSGNIEPALQFAHNARDEYLACEAAGMKITQEDIQSVVHVAEVCNAAHDFSTAIVFYKKALDVIVRSEDTLNTANIGHFCNNIGLAYRNLEQYEESLSWYQRARKEMEKSDIPRSSPAIYGMLLHNMGKTYALLGQLDQAEEYLLRGMRTRASVLGADNPEMGISYSGLGELYGRMGKDRAKAIEYLLKDLTICTKAAGPESRQVAFIHADLGECYTHIKKPAEAERHYTEGVRLLTNLLGRTHPELLPSLCGLGAVKLLLYKFPESREAFKRAMTIAKQTDNRQVVDFIQGQLGQIQMAEDAVKAGKPFEWNMETHNGMMDSDSPLRNRSFFAQTTTTIEKKTKGKEKHAQRASSADEVD